MAKYIDKSALVAEIEARYNEYSSSILRHYDACTEARASELGKILVILNSLEVKEVNLDKEFDKCCENYIFDDECEVYTAKHFFKLGFKVK